MKQIKKHCLFLTIFIFLFSPLYVVLFHPGMLKTDDGIWMVIRFSGFYQELINGQFPVRWISRLNYGYGYPVATFLYPGFMYIASIFKIIGFSFITSVKLVIAISIVLYGLFTYKYIRLFFSQKVSLISLFLSVYQPYFLYDFIKRGSVGEILAISTVPILLYFLEKKCYTLVSILYGLLILSHNTLAMLFVIFLLGYSLIRKIIKQNLLALIGGVGLSSFFWIPALFELSFTVFQKTKISNWFEYFISYRDAWLLFPSLIAFIFSLKILLKSNIQKNRYKKIVLFYALLAIFTIFLSTKISWFIWNIIPLGIYIQFPFRFLSINVIASSFLFAYILSFLWSTMYIKKVMIFFVLFIYLSINYIYFLPLEYNLFSDEYYATNEATTTVQDEYMPIWVQKKPQQHFSNYIEYRENGKALINRIYWPGTLVYVNNIKKDINYQNEKGIMEVAATPKDIIVVNFQETKLRIISNTISIITLIIIGIVILWKARKNFISN